MEIFDCGREVYMSTNIVVDPSRYICLLIIPFSDSRNNFVSVWILLLGYNKLTVTSQPGFNLLLSEEHVHTK